MPVYIYEEDAFDKIVKVEGDSFEERRNDTNDYSFKAFLAKWQELKKALGVNFPDDHIVNVNSNNAIYGHHGWNRYAVLDSGEIRFGEHQALLQKDIAKAQKVGFNIL